MPHRGPDGSPFPAAQAGAISATQVTEAIRQVLSEPMCCMIGGVPFLESLRQLDKRVLGPLENDQKRVARWVPIYLGLALILQGYAAATDEPSLDWTVFWLVVMSLSHVLWLRWWEREP